MSACDVAPYRERGATARAKTFQSGTSWLPGTTMRGPGKKPRKARACRNSVFAGALSQISGYDEQIRVDGANLGRDGFHELAICLSEMQIRKVDEGFHEIAPLSGPATVRIHFGRCKDLQGRRANPKIQGHVHADGFAIQRNQHGGAMRGDLERPFDSF